MYPSIEICIANSSDKILILWNFKNAFFRKKSVLKSLFGYNTINNLIIFLQKLLYFFDIIWYNYYMILRGLLC